MKMIEIIDALLMKNRTIVSSDFEDSISLLASEIPLTVHRFPSGQEYGTWVIPDRWDVKKAVLSDGQRVIASYDDHPLFLAPYSHSFKGWVSREELLKHVRSVPENPEVYYYEHRLAYDYRRRLKEWRISLPHSLVQTLDKPRYLIDIEVDTGPGHMLVGDCTVHGKHDYTFTLLAHLCHIGQANDGLSGVAVGVEVMKRIREEFPKPNYSYQLLVMPEVIGSVAYLVSNEDRIDSYFGAVFIEMAGVRSPLCFSRTRRGDTYVDRLLRQMIKNRHDGQADQSISAPWESRDKISGDDDADSSGAPAERYAFTWQDGYTEWSFGTPWGNDEKVFDSGGVAIPGALIGRYPFRWYHSSGDSLEETDEASLEEVVDVLMDTVRAMESDFIPRPRQRVPFYLTRFGLYADAYTQIADYELNTALMWLLWDGISVVDMAVKLDAPIERVASWVRSLVDLGLIEAEPLTPEYVRKGM